jgi:hypothetical protein
LEPGHDHLRGARRTFRAESARLGQFLRIIQNYQQIDKIYLALNSVAIIIHRAALHIHLCANIIALVVHLIATIGSIILVRARIGALVSAIALVSANQNGVATTGTAALILLELLIVFLNPDILALATHLVAAVEPAFLAEPPVDALIPTVSLIRTKKSRAIAAIVRSHK